MPLLNEKEKHPRIYTKLKKKKQLTCLATTCRMQSVMVSAIWGCRIVMQTGLASYSQTPMVNVLFVLRVAMTLE